MAHAIQADARTGTSWFQFQPRYRTIDYVGLVLGRPFMIRDALTYLITNDFCGAVRMGHVYRTSVVLVTSTSRIPNTLFLERVRSTLSIILLCLVRVPWKNK